MELPELITIWKKQDQYIDAGLHGVAFQPLLRYQSEGVLSKIRRHLRTELLLIGLLALGMNGLFFLVDVPFSSSRWIGLTTFDLIVCLYGYRYLTILHILRYTASLDLRASLDKIVRGLQRFQGQNKTFNLPVGVVAILMFSLSQQLVWLLPWLVGEWLLWKWLLTPRMRARFDWYLMDLEYTLKRLQ